MLAKRFHASFKPKAGYFCDITNIACCNKSRKKMKKRMNERKNERKIKGIKNTKMEGKKNNYLRKNCL